MFRLIKIAALLVLFQAGLCLASEIDGKWKTSVAGPDGQASLMTFTFKVENDALTGTVEGSMGTMQITNGKVNGNEFSFDVDANGMKITHQCAHTDGRINMQFTMAGGAPADLVLEKAE